MIMKTIRLLSLSLFISFFSITGMFGQKVLFLTNQVPTTNQADLTVIQTLEDEAYDVVVKRSQDFDKSTDLEDIDCIFVSEAIGSGDPASLYAAELAGEIGIAIINNEPYGYNMTDRLPWASGNRKGNTDFSKIFITEAGATHPIAVKAGFTTVTSDEADAVVVLQKTDPAGSPCKMCYVGEEDVTVGTVIGWDGSTVEGTGRKALLFAIEKGTEMKNGVIAAGRRIGFFIANGSSNELTDEGKALLLASVEWGIEGNSLDIGTGIMRNKSDLKYQVTNSQIVINEEDANLEIYTIAGVLCESLVSVKSYDYSVLNKGIYVARIVDGNHTETFKLNIK